MRPSEKLHEMERQTGLSGPQKGPCGQKAELLTIPGQVECVELGQFFWREICFPLDHTYGEDHLGALLEHSARSLRLLSSDQRIAELDFRRAVFLDVETTGLVGGTGTYAFLVGVGEFSDQGFSIRQYFMRDFDEEMAMLSGLNAFLSPFDSLVTYNGKRFDLPLLDTRYHLCRLGLNLKDPIHLDLLYPTRRLWSRRLPDCSLATVEKEIIKVSRKVDIPGWLIPSAYFQYITSGEQAYLPQIFEHNIQDILTLVALAHKACQVVESPLSAGVQHPDDLYSLGLIYDRAKDYSQSRHWYDQALNPQLSAKLKVDLLWRLSLACKRTGRWQKAVSLWEEMVTICDSLLPCVELAKYYEHIAKDISSARRMAKEALRRLEIGLCTRNSEARQEKELLHRLRRLNRKMAGGSEKGESP
jgi:uncharacterized protein YprB with RNaseH-like and TPR domain